MTFRINIKIDYFKQDGGLMWWNQIIGLNILLAKFKTSLKIMSNNVFTNYWGS